MPTLPAPAAAASASPPTSPSVSLLPALPLLPIAGAAGGHYTAMCRVPQAGGSQDDAWYSFNDENVSRVNPSQASKPSRCC